MPANVNQTPFIIRPRPDLLQQYPAIKHASRTLAHKYAFRELVTDEELKNIGHLLWQAMAIEADFAQAKQQSGVQILPLIIESNDPAIQQLPWETLYHPEYGFLGRAAGYTLSRNLTATPTQQARLETGPLRVLLFTSLPDDLNPETSRLNVEEEQSQVQEALLPWLAKGLVELKMPDDGRFFTLQELLRTFQPHLCFISGHGKFYDQPHQAEVPYATFLFESEDGRSESRRGREIAQAFVGSSVQVVILSACESGKAASETLTNGLTCQLSELGIPHVIGMRESILDRAGILFARHFCDAIARQERVDVALQEARQAITTPLQDIPRRGSYSDGLRELSLGQWCLPLLISWEAGRPLIDWTFTPQPPEPRLTNQSLNTISLPPRFVGRRSELRQLKHQLGRGQLKQLLITGPGGQGKTALAGKLAQDLQRQGYEILAWSARSESEWNDFLFELEIQLSPANAERYDRMRVRFSDEADQAKTLLRLLLQQYQNRMVLFFDNLESIQNPQSLILADSRLQAWITTAQSLAPQGLILLLTSRWQLPGWPDEAHWSLSHASYGDFLQMAHQQGLPPEFFQNRDRLRQVYDTLHGNGRGLEFFAAAIQTMEPNAEEAFLSQLAQVESELQINMALAQIVEQLKPGEQALLHRLPAYHTPVPIEGIISLGPDLSPSPDILLSRLLAVSLVERTYDPDWQAYHYQCSPLVIDWLQEQGVPPPARHLFQTAASYQHYLYENERPTLNQAIIVYQARRRAAENNQADRFALDHIVGPLNRYGFFRTLLTEWLPDICRSPDRQIQAEALGQTGKQLLHVGDYATALDYLQQSLAIRQEIGDKAGEGTTLNNISQIFKARGDYATALDYLQQSLAISQEIGDKAGEGTTLNNIAAIYHANGDYATALDYLQQSLAISQEIGDKAGEGTTLNNISQIFKARGDYATALDYLQQSLAISQEIGDKAGEGTTLNNISQIFKARGDYATALDYLQQSLAIRQEIGDKAGEGTTLNNISQIFKARGDYATALDYLQQSLAIQQEIGDKAGEGTTLNNISQIYDARGDYATALDYLQQSLAIQQEIGDKAGEGTTLNNISQIYDARGDYATALDYLQQSLAIRQEIGDKAGLCATLFNMGHIHLQNKEVRQAIQAWVVVYRLATSINLAQALNALENLAGQLGLPGGLAGWEQLARQMEENE